MIKILLVEDHNIVRNGIKTLLDAEEHMSVVGEFGSAAEALNMLEEGLEANVILTDINMPEMDGISFASIASEKYPSVKIIILSMYDQEDYINQAFKNGASGYMLKNVSPDELTFAIRHVVLREERYICSELALKMLERQLKSSEMVIPDNLDFDFSRREIEVLTLVSEGYTNQEIAERLNTSKRTVEGHRQNLIDKTGVRNSIALIRFSILNGLIN
jgi:two-component system response regulator NreC